MKANFLYSMIILGSCIACGQKPQSSTLEAAAKPNLNWNCDSDSDPDTLSIAIRTDGDKMVATLGEQTGDGDNFDSDHVVVEKTYFGQHLVYQQKGPALKSRKDSGRSLGLRLELTEMPPKNPELLHYAEGSATMKVGPGGGKSIQYDMYCVVKR